MSVRAEHERGTYNNKVSAMFADLPVAIDDPVERLRSISEQTPGAPSAQTQEQSAELAAVPASEE